MSNLELRIPKVEEIGKEKMNSYLETFAKTIKANIPSWRDCTIEINGFENEEYINQFETYLLSNIKKDELKKYIFSIEKQFISKELNEGYHTIVTYKISNFDKDKSLGLRK